MTLVLHDDTKQHLQAVLSRPPQALVLSGPLGAGKDSIVHELAKQWLGADPDSSQYYTVVEAAGGIEAVRSLQHFLALKVVGGQRPIERVAVIRAADTLSVEAQNALLKVLEEPPAGAVFLLLASQPNGLLPTIHSRTHHIPVARPAAHALQDHFVAEGHDAPEVNQAIALGRGLPGVVAALLSKDDDTPIRQALDQARTILRATAFERLAAVDGLAKQKPLAVQTLQMLAQMAEAALNQLAANRPAGAEDRVANWQQIMTVATEGEGRLLANGQTKLVLTDTMLRLP